VRPQLLEQRLTVVREAAAQYRIGYQTAGCGPSNGHGVMEARRLYEPPFTDLTPQGPEGLFSKAAVDELVAVLRYLDATAIAA
jgi:hypothetical protein